MVGRVQSQEGYPLVIIIVVVVDVVKVVRSHLSWSFVELLSLSLSPYSIIVNVFLSLLVLHLSSFIQGFRFSFVFVFLLL